MKRLTLIAATALAAGVPAWAGYGDGAGYGGHMWNGGYGHGLLGGLLMLLFWGALIVLTVLAVRWLLDRDNGGTGGGRRGGSAEDILKERLAKGEIEPEEYRERIKTLREDH